MNENHLTALGQGQAQAMPDFATLTMAVTVQASEQAEAVRQNAEQTTEVGALLREAGIADKDIQTQHYRVQPQYIHQKMPLAPDNYWVQNSLQVTVRDLSQIGFVVDKVTTHSSLSVDQVSFGLSNRAQAEAEALSQAVVSAQRKAGVMAAAAGVSLGCLVSVTEGASDASLSSAYARLTLSDASEPTGTPFSAQQVTVNAFVTLVYALEPDA